MENNLYTNIESALVALQNLEKRNDKKQISIDNIEKESLEKLIEKWGNVSLDNFLSCINKNVIQKKLKIPNDYLEQKINLCSVKLQKMNPVEISNGGQNLTISYHFSTSPFGKILIATTPKGICSLAFSDNDVQTIADAKKQFPNAKWIEKTTDNLNLNHFFVNENNTKSEINLHLKATDFQLQVWKKLLSIPFGQAISYSKIALQINRKNAARAVGTAIANNPIAYIIPCHRVLPLSGEIGGYRWGNVRKKIMLGWEGATCIKS